MANIRSQRSNKSKQAHDDAETSKGNADAAAGWNDGREVVKQNSATIQVLVEAVQRLEAQVERLLREHRKTESESSSP